MPANVSEQNVIDGIKLTRKAEIFPGYNGNDEDYIDIDPGDDVCNDVVTVSYDTNFAISASDASTLTELIQLAKGIIPHVSGTPTANTVINGVSALNSGINNAVDSEKATGSQEFKFTATPCKAGEGTQQKRRAEEQEGGQQGGETSAQTDKKAIQCFSVTLTAIGTALITDADPSDKDEQVHLSLTLSSRDKTASKNGCTRRNQTARSRFMKAYRLGRSRPTRRSRSMPKSMNIAKPTGRA
ncbi:MAG: hypothetical protein ACI8R4_003063 [Paracoccaceae bacterium]|jgi:hypothetical protein